MRYIVVPLQQLDAGAASAPHVRPQVPPRVQPPPVDPLGHWVAVARACLDACLVVDAGGTVAAVSPTAADLLGCPQDAFVGKPLEEAIFLLDFTGTAGEAQGLERRIPPLIALRENSLSRGVIRVRRPDGHRLMLDAVAAPIHDCDSRPVGAVSFLASV